MYREIKFRVWDEKSKSMRMAEQIGFISTHDEYGDEGGLPYTVQVFDGKYYADLPPDRFILMQFTGLNDKNGREIYEGDILAARLFGNDNHTTPFQVKWDERMAAWEINGYLLKNYDEWEVIGNIHENAELIDDQELAVR